MKAAIIGFVSGVVIILIFVVFKRIEKKTIYGLILAVIGFLYVGFTWSDFELFSINTFQAIFFLFFAYFGIKWNSYILIAGYFLHGVWDLIYSQVVNTALLPPQYDLFCSILDFTVGLYLLLIRYQLGVKAKA